MTLPTSSFFVPSARRLSRVALTSLAFVALAGCPGTSSPPGTDSGSTIDAAPDLGDTGGGGGTDGGSVDGAVVCTGAHPIVGPTRTCEMGSCYCASIDTCFRGAIADACCEDPAFTCVPMDPTCSGVHPIIGPPRTCESGRCYCASQDSCFPAADADRCCAVDVVCVP